MTTELRATPRTLAELSEAATPGPISLNRTDRLKVLTSMDHPMCEFSDPYHRQFSRGEGRDPEFMVALWNAYRAGELIEAARSETREKIIEVVARTVDLGGQAACILDAPCVFCGYNGSGYWQSGTHSKDCPFHEVGGDASRADHIVSLAKPCETCNGKPEVCATVPGLRHCEAANRTPSAERRIDPRYQGDDPAAEYAKRNPLGGPAGVFRAMAARIEAGESYDDVLDDYGFQVKGESAMRASPEFAALCRPAVKSALTKVERALLGKYPDHYKPILEAEANRMRALLDEIDALLATTDRT